MTLFGYTLLGIIVLIFMGSAFFWTTYKNTPETPQPQALIANDDLIKVPAIITATPITSPLTVTGEARGTWYFEASFPVKIYDAEGNLLGVIPAQAQSDWMTENYVLFSAILTFATSTTKTGTLVFEKDNPSGLPEHDNKLVIPVTFATTTNK